MPLNMTLCVDVQMLLSPCSCSEQTGPTHPDGLGRSFYRGTYKPVTSQMIGQYVRNQQMVLSFFPTYYSLEKKCYKNIVTPHL